MDALYHLIYIYIYVYIYTLDYQKLNANPMWIPGDFYYVYMGEIYVNKAYKFFTNGYGCNFVTLVHLTAINLSFFTHSLKLSLGE
jgi:hypothetical protein